MRGFVSLIVSLLAILMFIIMAVSMPVVDAFIAVMFPYLDGTGKVLAYLFKLTLLFSPSLMILGYHALSQLRAEMDYGGRRYI